MSASRPTVLVIGAGSIGRRHATNLDALGASVTVVDVEMGEVVPSGFDGVVVATPSTLHARHGLAALGTGATVFIEKPLAATVAEARTLLDAGSDRIMVGYNLRYHEPNLRLAALLEGGAIGRPISYRFWFGHWLPDWRPGTDYRNAYSARSDLGGGVLFDAIHELDLAVWMAGPDLSVVGALVARVGPLEIDVEDTVRALLTTPESVPVTVDLDYLSCTYRRGIEIIGEAATVSFDWSTRALTLSGPGGVSVEQIDTEVSKSYVDEMAEFLAFLGGAPLTRNSAEVGLQSLELAEEVARVGRR